MLDIARLRCPELDKMLREMRFPEDGYDPKPQATATLSAILRQKDVKSVKSRLEREVNAFSVLATNLPPDNSLPADEYSIVRLAHYGKAKLQNGEDAGSICSEERSNLENKRRSSWFLSSRIDSDGRPLAAGVVGSPRLGRIVAWVDLTKVCGAVYAVTELHPDGASLCGNGTAPYFPSTPTKCVLLEWQYVEEVVAVYESRDQKVFVHRRSEAGAWGFATGDESDE